MPATSASDSRSSSASSTSTSPAHQLPARPSPAPAPSSSSSSAPFTPVHPTITLMTPTPPPSTRTKGPSIDLSTAKFNPPEKTAPAFNNATPNPLQTTNVYINGLPPHYKDEELYALASQFGTVLSCRTFTRQLSDTPSGYGFVLFDSVDAAQECINVLRSHHNLHPHFAKQAHKIPGVPTQKPEHPADIYIEGLPMHVDAPTLHALLSPHAVLSSRFFADTRSQPPLLVAFVRLTSRAAAEDVYGRLHGRTIRGYSARLSVSLGDAEEEAEAMSSGLPAPPPDAYDPFADQGFSGQRPVDDLLHTLQGMTMQTPLSTTLNELKAQLEALRPLLASYNTRPVPGAHMMQPRNLNNTLLPNPTRLRSFSHSHDQLLTPGIGGHSRAHTTGHAHAGLGLGPLGAPVFSQRHTSNPEKAPGSERTWTARG